jgi:hypothetical protein
MELIVTDHDEKTWGMMCHFAAFLGFVVPLGNILGPLLVYLMKKDTYRFVEEQGKESLNFEISMTIYFLICIPLVFVVVGIIILPVLIIFWIAVVIIAAVKNSEGRGFRYPMTIRFIQ